MTVENAVTPPLVKGSPGAVRLAWSLWLCSVVLILLEILLLFLDMPDQFRTDWAYALNQVIYRFTTLVIGMVGALITTRRPQNPVGWLLSVAALSTVIQQLCLTYVDYTFVRNPGVLPGGMGALWLGSWLWVVQLFAMLGAIVLFPTGRFLSPIWRWVAIFALVEAVILMLFYAFLSVLNLPGVVYDFTQTVPNPIGLIDASQINLQQFLWVGNLFLAFSVLLPTLLSVGWRFYAARGVERLQMKWFAYAVLLSLGPPILFQFLIPPVWFGIISSIAALGIPVAIGIAILQYRLYDIDIIIRRTLIYTVLTGLLALIYFGSVVIFQQLLRPFVGEGETPLVTVASTLALAALFTPLRRRVQEIIDRRFYRRKYDAEQVLATFGETVRNETDLDKLNERLLAVVGETIQPTKLSLWLKPVEKR